MKKYVYFGQPILKSKLICFIITFFVPLSTSYMLLLAKFENIVDSIIY